MMSDTTCINMMFELMLTEILITLWYELKLARYTTTPKLIPIGLAVARSVPVIILAALILFKFTGGLVEMGSIVITSVVFAAVAIFFIYFINMARLSTGCYFDGEERMIREAAFEEMLRIKREQENETDEE